MTSQPFVHLHVHTQYSLLDGAIRIAPLVERAKSYNMNSLAITDHGVMFGALDFYKQAVAIGIKPIIGCECYIAPSKRTERTPESHKGTRHLVLLAKNNEGYRNLCKLVTFANTDGFYYRPRIDREIFNHHSKGLIALSACLHGEIPMLLRAGKKEEADEIAHWYLKQLGENHFFLELQKNNLAEQETVNKELADMAKRLGIGLVATNDCHYLDKHDVEAHDALLCIQTGKTIQTADRFRFSTDQLYFKSSEEMQAQLGEYKEALSNTQWVADQCDVTFNFKTYHFPHFETPAGISEGDEFEKRARAGLEVRLEQIRNSQRIIEEKQYWDRLEHEIKIIREMEFPGYFLMVADFIQYARDHAIPVGPGRGSAAGSMVSYALGITSLDPLELGLLFERFLNPSRKSMPDIDVDFCINGRSQVLQYVSEKYGGPEYVAQITTFGTLKARGVIRDVGRVLDIPLQEVDAIAKLVPEELGMTLDKAVRQETRLRKMIEEVPEVKKLFRIAKTLEGLNRHASTHAAGVVVGDRPLTDYLPLYRGKNEESVTQFDMKRVEEIGLVKFDFLGLRNLTIIHDTLRLIAAQGKTPPNVNTLSLDDPATYELLCSAETTGVFQVESSGMKDLLIRMRPTSFQDIVAILALYRPGPMESGMMSDYVDCKHGRKPVSYIVPELESILKETYGMIVYQEQVMQIAVSLSNYSMAEADDLRKAMGKKVPEIMEKQGERFVKGAIENGIDPALAHRIFDLIEKFGGYGFNKSHSAAYALITYQTAYLKAHFPIEFMAALLSSEMGKSDTVVKFVNECRAQKINLLPIDVNLSQKSFSVDPEGIRYGILAIKYVGESAIDLILEERSANGVFQGLYDFCMRMDTRRVNRRVIESLIKSGAFDSFGFSRNATLTVLDDAMEYAARIQREKNDMQISLFGEQANTDVFLSPTIDPLPEWETSLRLNFEKEMLGFYLSGHPLEAYEEILDQFTTANSQTLQELPPDKLVRIGGIVTTVKRFITKNGAPMAFVTVEDLLGATEVTVFSSLFDSVVDLLSVDTPVLIQGKTDDRNERNQVLAERIIPMEKATESWTSAIQIKLQLDRITEKDLKNLYQLCLEHPGICETQLVFDLNQKIQTTLRLSEGFTLKPSRQLFQQISRILGYAAVETQCMEITPNGGEPQRSAKYLRRK